MATMTHSRAIHELSVAEIEMEQERLLLQHLQAKLATTCQQFVADTNRKGMLKKTKADMRALVATFFMKHHLVTCVENVHVALSPLPIKARWIQTQFGVHPNQYWLRAGLYAADGQEGAIHIYIWPVIAGVYRQ